MPISDTSRIPYLYPVKKDPTAITIDYMLFQFDRPVAPSEVQRPIAWSPKERKAYFQSILMNRLEGGFVFVDMDRSVQVIETFGYEHDRAHKYFKKLIARGFKHLTLDGNNRWTFIRDLVEDRYNIPVGDYDFLIEDTLFPLTITKRNNVFSKLTSLQQSIILNRKVVVTEYTQLDYAGLSEIFLNINSGVPLNAQEKRNAMDSDWSEYVRQLSLDLAPLQTLILGENYHKRLAGDDWIATTVDYAIHCTPDQPCTVNQQTKNDLYKKDFGTHYTKEYRTLLLALQDNILDLVNDDKMPVAYKWLTLPSFAQNLFWAMCNGLTDYQDVFAFALKHQDARNNPNLCNEDGNNFVWACGGTGAKNNALKMEVLTDILEQTSGYVPNNRTLTSNFVDLVNIEEEEETEV